MSYKDNLMSSYEMERLNHQQVHMGHPFYSLKRKMVHFECVSTTELSTHRQFKIDMHYQELMNYSTVYMELKYLQSWISLVDIIRSQSTRKIAIRQPFELDMDIMNLMLCHLV